MIFTTTHFFPSKRNTGGDLAAGLGAAADLAGLELIETTPDARKAGFLCVFISFVTFFKPCDDNLKIL